MDIVLDVSPPLSAWGDDKDCVISQQSESTSVSALYETPKVTFFVLIFVFIIQRCSNILHLRKYCKWLFMPSKMIFSMSLSIHVKHKASPASKASVFVWCTYGPFVKFRKRSKLHRFLNPQNLESLPLYAVYVCMSVCALLKCLYWRTDYCTADILVSKSTPSWALYSHHYLEHCLIQPPALNTGW